MNSETNAPLLEIKDLNVAYRQGDRWNQAVRNASFSIQEGETVGLVGESGSGKTTLALALLGYLPEKGMVCEGSVKYRGRELLGLDRNKMRELWGGKITFVPQNALPALNPSMKLGEQVVEQLILKSGLSRREARDETLRAFGRVKLGDSERVFDAYPHQLSAGMLQRVMIAMAVCNKPDLLVLDEPTSNLDVTIQSAMLDLFRELIEGDLQTAVLYITHNLGVVAQICDQVAVLYAGDLVEFGPTDEIYHHPVHPYTPALLDCVPRLGDNKQDLILRPIQGRIPSISDRPSGCVFRPRCPLAIEICEEYPPLYEKSDHHRSRCHRWEEIMKEEIDPHQQKQDIKVIQRSDIENGPLMETNDLKVYFQHSRSLLDMITGEPAEKVRAVDGVSVKFAKGQVLGLVGESGSGKTTFAHALIGLNEYTQGSVKLTGSELPSGLKNRQQEDLQEIQIIFQNPGEALNPYLSVRQALLQPLKRMRGLSGEKLEDAIDSLLDSVNLGPEFADKLPDELSGGEKQRIALARAMAPFPNLLIADEPVSSLDVSVQASILNLMNRLQADQEIGMLFISHDLAVIGYLADEIAVIYLGQLMEKASADSLFEPPHHPYTEVLLSSVPLIDPKAEQKEVELSEEVPSSTDEITGCPFHTRCPRFLGDICVDEVPPWRVDEDTGKQIFCHIPLDELEADQELTFQFSQEHDISRRD